MTTRASGVDSDVMFTTTNNERARTMNQEPENEAYAYARTIAETVLTYDRALCGDRDALRAVFADRHGVDVGTVSDDDVDQANDDGMMGDVLAEWPLEVRTVWSEQGSRRELVAVVLIVTVGGPHCEVELPYDSPATATVTAHWGGQSGRTYPAAQNLADWFGSMFDTDNRR